MDSKLSILLVLTAVARISLALDTSGSCATKTTIEADLAAIQFAEDTPRQGYRRLAGIINTEILTVMAERFGKISTDPEAAALKAARGREETYTAIMLGVIPTFEAYIPLHPDIDIPGLVSIIAPRLLTNNGFYWSAIAAAQGCNYSEAKAEIANLSNLLDAGSTAAIEALFDVMLNETASILEGAEDVVACIKAQSTSELVAAGRGIFEQINLLLEALFNTDTDGAYDKYSSAIIAAHKRTVLLFDAEVIHKVSVLRNVVIAQYLNKNGILAGLFAL